MSIRLVLPFPVSVNAAYANGGNKRGRHKTAVYKQWERVASLFVKDSHRIAIGPYSLSITLNPPDRRARDLGNYEKVISDFLVMHGVVKDDSFCRKLTMVWNDRMAEECVVQVEGFAA